MRPRSIARHRPTSRSTRQTFLDELEGLPYVHKAVRIRKLSEMVDEAVEDGSRRETASLLEQIAKEMGGVYTNRREFSGQDGGPLEYRDLTKLSDEELDAHITALLGPPPTNGHDEHDGSEPETDAGAD